MTAATTTVFSTKDVNELISNVKSDRCSPECSELPRAQLNLNPSLHRMQRHQGNPGRRPRAHMCYSSPQKETDNINDLFIGADQIILKAVNDFNLSTDPHICRLLSPRDTVEYFPRQELHWRRFPRHLTLKPVLEPGVYSPFSPHSYFHQPRVQSTQSSSML